MSDERKILIMFGLLMGFVCLIMLCGCGYVPQMLQEAEHVADDTCISLKISQEALRKDTNIKACVEVENSKYDIK